MSNEVERELMKCKVAIEGESATPALERVEWADGSGSVETPASASDGEGAGGVAGNDAGKPAQTPRYSAGNVVLADVDHLRAYRGETDELIYRMRTVEAEEEFMRLLDGGMEPDWFVERWDGGRKVLVACLVFEREEGAKALGEALKRAVADGTAKCVRFRDDAAMREEVAEYFSAEWGKAHEREMARVAERYAEAVKGYGERILVGWVEKEKLGKFSEFTKVATGIVAHGAVLDDVLGRINMCFGFRSGENAARLLCVLAGSEFHGCFALPRIDMADEVPRQMVVAMAKRLAAHDAKSKAAEVAKDNGKDVG